MSTPLLSQSAPRVCGGLHTTERLANIARNVERYDWARDERDRAVRRAASWAKMSDEALWALVPGQALPRCIDVTMTYTQKGKARPGCLICGDEVFKHGNYPYGPDVFGLPWKLTCPSCRTVFPTNDFGVYYRSGIDRDGCFNPEKADRSLLFNAEHPDPADPLHKWGVDDGFGYIDENGLGHRYIAYYTWKLWQRIIGGVDTLAQAYILSGDAVYARKCAILLDRIADVYPDMDWNEYAVRGWYHSDGGSKKGKIEGRIWETGVLKKLALSYDRVLAGLAEQDELYAFLGAKAAEFALPTPKGTREQLMQSIDDRILRCGADAVQNMRIWGNEGMHQAAMAACAIALDTEPDTSAMIDWIFAEKGGHIPAVIVGGIDRDGVGAEAGPGYALSWGGNIGAVADLLAQYGKYTTWDIYRDFPQFAQTFTAGSRLTILDYDTPSIGDTGSTGSIGKVQCDPDFIIRGYRFLRDPDIALAAYRENGLSAAGLGRHAMDTDGESVEREIETIVDDGSATVQQLGPHNMAGYGMLTLETGAGKNGAGVFMYYGRNSGHGHPDRLNVGIYAFGFDLTPDLGYPEFATSWPKRNEWTCQTIAHNTVVVDHIPQKRNWVGHPTLFKVLPGIQCAEVESSDVYPGVRDYRRTVLWIPLSETTGYMVDIFRVEGGNDHLRSFHGASASVTTSGLKLTAQETGTLAGPDIKFGTSRPGAHKIGYSWLTNVEQDDAPPPAWTAEWAVPAGYRGVTEKDNIAVKMWDMTPVDSVILADGEPPQNKKGNPRWLRYCLSRRSGEDLTSTFVSVVEPYRRTPVIASVERLPLGIPDHGGPVALRVSLVDGQEHILLYTPDGGSIEVGDVSFSGRIGLLKSREGAVTDSALVQGTSLTRGAFSLVTGTKAWTGRIMAREQSPEGEALIRVEGDLPADAALIGDTIIIKNDRERNACYTIKGIREQDGQVEISLGRVSLVRNYVDRNDYARGYVYNFEVGDKFTIPTHVSVSHP